MNPTTTLLIVEDDERIRNYMKTILTTCDYAVLETGNARTALSIIASHSPDLVLLDLGLPDGDGIDMLRSIREWSQVPVIVVSARGHERDKVAALDGGAYQEAADRYGLPLLAKMPIDPALAALVDAGRIEDFQGSWLSAAADRLEC